MTQEMHVSAGSHHGRSVTIYGPFKADGVPSETSRAIFVGQTRGELKFTCIFPSFYSAFVRLSSRVPLPTTTTNLLLRWSRRKNEVVESVI